VLSEHTTHDENEQSNIIFLEQCDIYNRYMVMKFTSNGIVMFVKVMVFLISNKRVNKDADGTMHAIYKKQFWGYKMQTFCAEFFNLYLNQFYDFSRQLSTSGFLLKYILSSLINIYIFEMELVAFVSFVFLY